MPTPFRFRTWRRLILILALCTWAGAAYWGAARPLPQGVRTDSPWVTVPAADVGFIADLTAADAYGHAIVSQDIFDSVLRIVRSARSAIVLDYFLFNGLRGNALDSSATRRAICEQLRDALIEQRREHPGLRILFITDPINDVYGSVPSRDLLLLRAAGVEVVVTDLDRLRDSNPLYTGLWRLGLRWWSPDRGSGWLPSPLEETDAAATFGAWARLLNFKANHRGVVVADDGRGGLVGIIGSANPHDASSAHSNVALKVAGAPLQSLLRSELAIARFSGWTGDLSLLTTSTASQPAISQASGSRTLGADIDADFAAGRTARIKILTEGAIRDSLQQRIASAGRSDSIDIAMFYLSDRSIIESLLEASRRGVSIRLILDPNKDAFGHLRSGIPNRPMASELVSASDGRIHLRWFRTHGEQFHSKLVMIYGPQRVWLTLGSANLTRRNLGDLNLEANVAVETARHSLLAAQVLEFFELLWNNRPDMGIEYTSDFGAYADPAQTRYWLYRFMEGTGLSTF